MQTQVLKRGKFPYYIFRDTGAVSYQRKRLSNLKFKNWNCNFPPQNELLQKNEPNIIVPHYLVLHSLGLIQ